jgi:hypothetical protein
MGTSQFALAILSATAIDLDVCAWPARSLKCPLKFLARFINANLPSRLYEPLGLRLRRLLHCAPVANLALTSASFGLLIHGASLLAMRSARLSSPTARLCLARRFVPRFSRRSGGCTVPPYQIEIARRFDLVTCQNLMRSTALQKPLIRHRALSAYSACRSGPDCHRSS